jgi:hypothetical protein
MATSGVVFALTAPDLPAGCDADKEQCAPLAGESPQELDKRQAVAGESKGRPLVGGATAGVGVAMMIGGLLWHFLEPTGPVPAAVRIAPFVAADRAGAFVSAAF